MEGTMRFMKSINTLLPSPSVRKGRFRVSRGRWSRLYGGRSGMLGVGIPERGMMIFVRSIWDSENETRKERCIYFANKDKHLLEKLSV
jgi:hypothetical protein